MQESVNLRNLATRWRVEYAAQRLGYDREEMSGVFYFKSDLNSLDI